MESSNDSKLHFALFPWLAFGHMIPYLELSKSLAIRGHKVTFISTPRNIDRLLKLPQFLSCSITFLKISLPRIPQLQDHAEATRDIKMEDMNYLKKAYNGMENELTEFLENSVPDWIIYDFSPHWLPPIAQKLGISRAFFCIINAWFLAFFSPTPDIVNGSDYRTKPEDFTVPPKWITFETKLAYKLFETGWIIAAGQANETGVSDISALDQAICGSDVLLLRHSTEFEGEWLKLLEGMHHKPVIPLGLMPPVVEDVKDETWDSIKEFLGTQKKDSVLYVALGSEVTLSEEQHSELAMGLELSGVPFFWILRNPPGPSQPDLVKMLEGVEERVKGRGVVWKGWAPQLRILSHDSVGGFLTHCGWSSLIEGVMLGHPMVMLPFVVDQGLNARVFADKKIGMEIPRNEVDGSYVRESVAETVRSVMVEDEGMIFKEKAKEMSKVFGDAKLQNHHLENAILFLENFYAEHKSRDMIK
ncbi:hypothetical protein Leryth_023247 [Lithospermum erythrorhizon]|nr:hypothetical protein Leryth_023247 [Lithospermum erythrorhizon]